MIHERRPGTRADARVRVFHPHARGALSASFRLHTLTDVPTGKNVVCGAAFRAAFGTRFGIARVGKTKS